MAHRLQIRLVERHHRRTEWRFQSANASLIHCCIGFMDQCKLGFALAPNMRLFDNLTTSTSSPSRARPIGLRAPQLLAPAWCSTYYTILYCTVLYSTVLCSTVPRYGAARRAQHRINHQRQSPHHMLLQSIQSSFHLSADLRSRCQVLC